MIMLIGELWKDQDGYNISEQLMRSMIPK